ncbi:MAG: serine/threonine protein kinase [Myxococcales bacterium]|nr:serine/threonine protein kinase [Myxococcales bacterium]
MAPPRATPAARPSQTLAYESHATPAPTAPPASQVATLVVSHPAEAGLAHTLAADASPSSTHAATAADLGSASTKATLGTKVSTVLPEVSGDGVEIQLIPRNKARYNEVKKLGEGGMGEVALAMDEDIGRKIALKRLHPEALTAAGMARFVDEVHIVGQLEHPNIVPIHDVGIDEQGRYFFVMKYVEGETLETLIEKLRDGDEKTRAKYTIEARVELFLGVLRALHYAHANGIVHRDLKPANVMVGPYGEVMLMDWGIAKPVRRQGELGGAADADNQSADAAPEQGKLGRRFTTRHGSLIGTPAYMSPEQALGLNDQIDERSDMYSAMVMLHELLGLKHYLHDKPSVAAMIHAVISDEIPVGDMGWYSDAPMGSPPAEYLHMFRKGFSKKPEARFQSAAEMIEYLQAILEGRCQVQCPITMTKRMTREAGRLVDRKPWVAFTGMIMSALIVLAALGVLVRAAIA